MQDAMQQSEVRKIMVRIYPTTSSQADGELGREPDSQLKDQNGMGSTRRRKGRGRNRLRQAHI